MRLSCCAYSYRQLLQSGRMTLEQFVETAAEIGCLGVELTAYYFPSLDRPYMNALKRHAHRLGLSVSGTAISTDFAQPDSDLRRSHVALTKEWVDHSVILGAPTLRVFAGPAKTRSNGATEEQAFAFVVDCLEECAEYAGEQGVLLALENHGGITATADQILAIRGAVDNTWLGINLDFGNFTGDAYAQIAACAPYAVSSHAKISYNSDNAPGGEPGREQVDFTRVRALMDNAGYRGFVAIEYEESQDPLIAVPLFAGELARVLAV